MHKGTACASCHEGGTTLTGRSLEWKETGSSGNLDIMLSGALYPGTDRNIF